MTLRLYDSLSRSLRPLEPLAPPRVNVYACGPTIYGRAHIGNFRTFVAYDLLHRYLEWKGLEPRMVVNLTDVDDKTINGAAAAGTDLESFTEPHGEAFLHDADTLGIRPFFATPRATAHVDEMVRWIERLEEKGLAYRADDGSVYFRISAFPDYGRLSGNRADGEEGRSRIDADEYEKDDVRDFVLWKAAREVDREVGAVWPSPWGEGRPGWHLECSVLSCGALGETLDLHLGGEDLLFPHHENEIAQSEGATGKPFARAWMHTKHLRVEGQKMSKSLGNVFTVPELLERGHTPAAIRHLLVSAQYRKELNFTFDGLEGSARAVQRLVAIHRRLHEETTVAPDADAGLTPIATRAVEAFEAALDDDLNSSEALAALFGFLRDTNTALDRTGGVAGESELAGARDALDSMDRVFGILELALRPDEVDDALATWVEDLIEQRREARAAKNWARADEIRDELTARGVVLEDTAQGTRWSV
ncbi:cysteine--tRNA ligase [Gaopeijia maritima]|uniref:cysteine--tRNA ligase n=1 Tax=Gaopeijia maritima TaxID=3119007 RepID=UPI00324B4C8B